MMTTKSISKVCCLLFAAFSLASCIDTEGIIDSFKEPNLPQGIKPSEEMTYGDAADEPYVNFAAKYAIKSQNNEYSHIEFFGDGTYLMTKKGAENQPQQPAIARRSASGAVMLSIPKTSRAVSDEYYLEGGYQVISDTCYLLNEVDSLFIKEGVNNEYSLIFTNQSTGVASTVYANKEANNINPSTKSLCRTWDIKNWEQWIYFNSFLMVHSKYFGEVEGQYPHYEGSIVENGNAPIQDLLNQECVTATFSPSGTYICHFRNGTKDVRTWQWSNEEKGILFFDWNRPGSETEEGYVTFRFAGDEARSYEDYKITKKDIEEQLGESFDEEVGEFESLRLLNVTTFKAAR